MKVNWKVRLHSKKFWMVFIPAILYLVSTVSKWFGLDINVDILTGEALVFVEGVFAVLILLGVVVDPTTDGLSDSERAMKY